MQSKSSANKKPYVEPYHEISFDDHGGGCCGVSHIYGFESVDIEEWQSYMGRKPTFKDKLRLLYEEMRDQDWLYTTPPEHCVEATLADYQFRDWHTVLLRFGFKRVTEFINGNTGRRIRIYHYYRPISKPKTAKDKKKPW